MARSPSTPTFDSATQGPAFLRELTELVRYRDLLWLMTVNIVKSRYSRSVLGVLWSLMNPLLSMTVLTIAFSNLFSSALPNYAVYVMSSIVCWNFFTATSLHAMSSLVWGGGLLRRIYIPRTVFSFAAVGHGLFNFTMALVPLSLLMVALDHPFTAGLWVLPFSVLLLTMFVLGVSLLVSTLAVLFTDVVELYQVLLQAFFFLTPIMYPVDILPGWARALVPFNPMFHLIEMVRVPVYAGVLPESRTVLAAVAASVIALLLGWTVFTRRADELAYRL